MKVYGIKNCDTVKKATAFLDTASIEYSFIDFKKENIPADTLIKWANTLGLTTLINIKSATYRALDNVVKDTLAINNCANVILQNQSIMKRPIIVYDNGDITAGFNESVKDKING